MAVFQIVFGRYSLSAFLFFLCFFGSVQGASYCISTKHFPTIGMFAAANLIMGYIDLYENGKLPDCEGLYVDFGFDGLYYDSMHGSNWWEYFFEPISIGKGYSMSYDPSWEEGCTAFRAKSALPRDRSVALANQYVRIKPHIQQKVDAFAVSHFNGLYTIGVHYRGTDKFSEAPRVDYSAVIAAVRDRIPIGLEWQIFVATDEASFLEKMEEAFPSHIVATYAYRSNTSEGVHFSSHNPYALGEEALIDALLLAKCDLLIRTSSNLSLWATYFNPDLSVVLLNERYEKWEELG